jgi:hypothetical protein
MIEGVVVANRLVPPAADRLRRELWLAVSSAKLEFVPPSVHDFTVVSDRGNAA